MVEWLMAPDCKSGRESVRWFESISAHHKKVVEMLIFQYFYDFYNAILTQLDAIQIGKINWHKRKKNV